MSGKLDEYFPTLRGIPAAWRGLRWLARKTWKASLALLVLLIIAHIALNIYAGYRLEGELEKIRAAGDPLTLREAAPPKVPNAQNAALVYMQALQHFKTERDEKEDPENRTIRRFIGEFRYDEEPRSTLAEVEPILAKHAEDFRLLKQASLMPACSFSVNWEDPVKADLSHLSWMRIAASFLAAKAIADARRGQSAAALEDFAVIVRMANHVAPEPDLVAQLARFRFFHYIHLTLPEVLSAALPNPAKARRFTDLLRQVDLVDPYVGALKGERCRQIFVYNLIRRDGPMTLLWLTQPIGTPQEQRSLPSRALNALLKPLFQPFLKLDEIWLLKAMEEQIGLAPKSYAQLPRAVQPAHPGPGQTEGPVDEQWDHIPGYAVVARIMMPVFSRAMSRRDETKAELGLTQLALALKSFQLEHGEYPASLSELSAAGWSLPADPFSGQPFVYRREGKGYLLYSIGPDLADSGGLDQKAAIRKTVEFSQKGKFYDETQYDITFRMTR